PGRGPAVRASEPEHPAGRPNAGGACKGAVGLCGAAGNEPRPHHRSRELFRQRGAALPADPGERGHPGALCHLGLSEGWGPAVGQGMGLWWDGPEPVRGVPQGGGGKPRPACRRGAAVLPA
ncbi:Transcriptional regulator, partial [Dysosmobacter welbionis]